MGLRDKGCDDQQRVTRHGVAALRVRRFSGRGQASQRPGAVALSAVQGRFSVVLCQLLVRLCLCARSYEAAARHLPALGLPSVSKETVRQIVQDSGQAAEAALDQQAIDLGWTAQGCPDVSRTRSCAIMGVDGFSAPTITDAEKRKRRRKVAAKRAARGRRGQPRLPPLPARKPGTDQVWKEAKAVGLYSRGHKHRHWRVVLNDHVEAHRLMGQISRKLRFDKADQRIAVTDGAPWIANRLADAHLNLDAHILDFYHLAEHVHEAAKDLHADDGEAKAWARQTMTAARTQGPTALSAALHALKPATEPRREALRKLKGYITPRESMIDYPAYEAQGWPIGSGPTESMCKTLPRFIKGPGKRWDPPNAQAMMSLEALDVCDELEIFFTHQRKNAA